MFFAISVPTAHDFGDAMLIRVLNHEGDQISSLIRPNQFQTGRLPPVDAILIFCIPSTLIDEDWCTSRD